MATFIGHVTRDRAFYWCGLPMICSLRRGLARGILNRKYDDARVCKNCRRARRAAGKEELASDEEFAAFRAEVAAAIEEREAEVPSRERPAMAFGRAWTDGFLNGPNYTP